MEQNENVADLRLMPVASLKGVGPVIAKKLARKGIETIEQLLYFVPAKRVDRGTIRNIGDLKAGEDASVVARVDSYRSLFFRHARKKGYEVVVADDTGFLSLKWFQWSKGYLEQICHKGIELFISGKVGQFGEFLQIVHPVVTVLAEDESPDSARTVLPVYSQVEGIKQGTVRNIMEEAVRVFNSRPFGILPASQEERHCLVPFDEAVTCAHGLDGGFDEERSAASVRRMILEEYLQFQTTLMAKKRKARKEKGIAFKTESPALRRFIDSLPFSLTAGQTRALGEILADMGRSIPMNRLLQGDVGSGKTVCAVAGACAAVDSGFQVAFMAPTEILAEQHYLNVHRWFGDLGISVALLKGKMGRQRKEVLEEIRSGAVPVIIGTHAIIQSDVTFHRLGLVIIDEQHRFGVDQRKRLRNKSFSPDVLNMSATPIPRTLSMVVYGDLDVSVIDTMPEGRQAVKTFVLSEDKRGRAEAMVEKELRADRGVFIVYPVIDESETPGMRNATGMAEHWQRSVFPGHRVGLLHGRMNTKDKENIMEKFRNRQIDILVCTTVIEVGIDVPHAAMIVVENAERFGLSQLHQLRGRVGRGSQQALCILLTSSSRTNLASKRLKIMEKTSDGFTIAEEDLRIRGVGDMLGVRQSGMPPFRIGDIVRDIDIMAKARKIAEEYTKTLSDRELQDLVAKLATGLTIRGNFPKLHEGLKRGFAMRKAKIVCTLGPPTQSTRALKALITNGMNVARLNFSHGDHASHGALIRKIRGLEKQLDKHVAILQDLQGIKIRVGSLEGGKALLQKGQPLEIVTGGDAGNSARICIDYPWLISDANPGDMILLDDGLIRLRVEEKSAQSLKTVVLEGGVLKEHKGVNLPGMNVSAPFFTAKDQADLEFGVDAGVDYVALSFVRTADDVAQVRAWLKDKGAEVPLIAKIEKQEAIENIDGILDLVDGIMVARGDLGVEMPLEEVPVFQKMLITKANRARKIVITATQMLESMTQHSRPTRAETTDVANAVLDGTDALMLSAETSAGKYPFESVAVMDRIISFTEEKLGGLRRNDRREEVLSDFAEAIAEAASRASTELSAKFILAFSMTGLTARLISKFRPHVPVIAISPDEAVVRRMNLYRGVVPFQVRRLKDTDRMIGLVDRFLLDGHYASEGDVVILVAGHPIAAKSRTNFMKIHRVGIVEGEK